MTETAGYTLVQLRYFVAVAEAGSMTAAAERLVVAQSGISHAIANLERELRLQLFLRRKAKALTLTPAGEHLLGRARALLAQADQLAEEARGGGELTGPVTLGCFVTLAPFHLPPLLESAERRHPGIELTVVEGEAAELDAALRAGRIEFALGYDLGFGPDTVLEPLASLPPYALVAADHPMAGRPQADLAELAEEPLVLLDLPHSREYFLGLVRAAGGRPRVRHRAQSYETVRSLVARGLGFALLNQLPATADTYGGGRVRALPLGPGHRTLELVIARPAGLRPCARARAVIDLLRTAAGAGPAPLTDR
ncbi:LysR substrate-binding domain-containing protein [Kitasatospora sp. NPDC059571]|uniref:LysR substrate-binding domain-containing protein n=1 Tax=Kitasatospora sp. NPDC059571 TaxID=3346871 RepID=UPI0036CDA954